MRRLEFRDDPDLPELLDAVVRLSRAGEAREVVEALDSVFRRALGARAFVWLNCNDLPPGRYRVTRLRRPDGEDLLSIGGEWFENVDAPVREGGFLGALIQAARPAVVRDLELDRDPVLGDFAAGYASAMAVPVFREGRAMQWAVLFAPAAEAFDAAELSTYLLRSNLIGIAQHNLRLARELRSANRWIDAEVDQIASLQKALLPLDLPHPPGLELAASYETFNRAGGDYYDIFPLRRGPDNLQAELAGPWGILIADASGHGPAAAVVIAMLHAILHAYPKEPRSPAELLDHLNRHIFSKRLDLTFVTAFLGFWNPGTREMTYCRAGHNPPLLRGRDGGFVELNGSGGLPLGIVPESDYASVAITLRPGETLVLYTDGIVETRSEKGRLLGLEGLERALDLCEMQDPACVVEKVLATVREYEAGRRPSDDQTLLVLRVSPGAPPGSTAKDGSAARPAPA